MPTLQKTAKRKRKFIGITHDAKLLGVNHMTLYRALTGRWKLPGLVARYAELKEWKKTTKRPRNT